MATIVKGTTFSSIVTAGGLHAMVELATISGIDRGAMRSSEVSVASLSASKLSSPSSREVWQTSPGDLLASWDATNSRWLGALPQVQRYTVAAGSSAVAAGDALMAIGVSGLGTLTLQLASGASTAKVVAIALAAAAVGEESICAVSGLVKASSTGAISAGQAVKLSSTAGKLASAGAAGTGKGWEVVGNAISVASGGLVWICLRR